MNCFFIFPIDVWFKVVRVDVCHVLVVGSSLMYRKENRYICMRRRCCCRHLELKL